MKIDIDLWFEYVFHFNIGDYHSNIMLATGCALSVTHELIPIEFCTKNVIEGSIAAQQEKPFLLVALRVQKCWAEMMLNCKALRAMGGENVAYVQIQINFSLLTTLQS